MALETLKGIKKIGKFDLIIMDELREIYPDKFNESGSMNYQWFEKDIRPNYFIYIRNDKNSISFTLQNGPIKEVGVNGCQVDELIEVAREIIKGFDSKFPSDENKICVAHLDMAMAALSRRTSDRVFRKVEGHSLN